MYRLHKADNTPTRAYYATEEKATRALVRRKEIGSSVVWYKYADTPKTWCVWWTLHGLDKIEPAVKAIRLRPCTFTFDGSPAFTGFTDGSTWNGFDNVWITPAERARIVAYFQEAYPGDANIAESNADMLAIPEENGLASLCNGYATQIARRRNKGSRKND